MRRRLLTLATALALAVPTVTAHAVGGVLTDPCGDASDPVMDVARAELDYSATSFQVRVEHCGFSTVDGDWWVTVHLPGFTPEVQITGAVTDFGKASEWSGFYLCSEVSCPVGLSEDFVETPTGTRLAGSDWYDNLDNPSLSGRSAYASGAWADLLPSATIPSTLDFYVTTHQGNVQMDRAPDAGTETSDKITVTRSSAIQTDPVPTERFDPAFGAFPVVTGRLTYDNASGHALPDRFATLYTTGGERYEPQFYGNVDFDAPAAYPPAGQFATAAQVARNATFKVGFDGDGFTNPSPRVTVRALVSAFVSLDLPATSTVRRGATVRFHGVVRPKQPGTSVLVQARSGGAGNPWRNWRTVPLVNAADTYYSFTWTPSTTGATTFRVVWQHGSLADGDVVNGMSNYATITVA